MKSKFLMGVAVCLVMTACDGYVSYMYPKEDEVCSKQITFNVSGDWELTDEPYAATRAAVAGSSMTDLWVMDYDPAYNLLQTVHQSASDADFGAPTIHLNYGTHWLYFVTSQGENPTLNTNNHTLSFEKVKDTFWKSVQVNVDNGTATNQSVTMDRIVTNLVVKPTDQVPNDLKTVDIQLSKWYDSIDYLSGDPTNANTDLVRSFNIANSYLGTTGTIYFIIRGFAGADFTTNVSVTAKDANNATIGFASIANAPMKRNRTSRYTGTLFGNNNAFSLNIDETWLSDYEGTW
jgi:hypothetical protein